jgi:hypothetical protein
MEKTMKPGLSFLVAAMILVGVAGPAFAVVGGGSAPRGVG